MKLSSYTKEFSYNLKLAYPVILGMVGHTLVSIVDNVMVGKLGAKELAAVSLGNSFIFIAMSLGIGFSTAITPLVAEADGKHDKEKAREAFVHGLFLCTILGLLLFLAVLLCKPLLAHMNQPAEVVELAKPYLDIVGLSLVPLIIFQGYKQFTDGLSKTKYAMWATIIGNITNVVLNYFLIYGVWLFPKMGIVGAAIGTIASRVVMLFFMHYFLVIKRKFNPYYKNFKWKEIKKEVNNKIIKLGIPSALQMFFEVVLFTSAIWLCGMIGTTSQAANQIALSLASFTFMFAMGLSVTAMIRVGNQKGLQDYEALRRIGFSIFLLTVCIQFIFALLFFIFNEQLPLMFISNSATTQTLENKELLLISSQLLIVAGVFQLFDGLQVVGLGALRGLQDAKMPMYLTFIAYWVIGFPVSYYLGLHTSLQAVGVWLGLFAGLTAAAILLLIRFNYLSKKHIHQN